MAIEKGSKLEDEELAAMIDEETQSALGNESDKLSRQRSSAMEYYYGEPYGTETAERSQVVTREVLNTIEWIKPELIKIFASGSETVRFEPQNMNDVPEAQQATDYINYLFHRKNNGFKIIYEWLTDGLLQKNGVVKIWYDTDRTKTREEYEGLTEQEMQMLVANEDIEVVDSEKEIVGGMEMYDVTVIRSGACKGIKLEVVPPEEFIISRKATNIEDSPFCAHRTRMTVSALNSMGFDTSELAGEEDSTSQYEDEIRARHKYDDTEREINESTSVDPTMREVWVTEAYIRMDWDGDGLA